MLGEDRGGVQSMQGRKACRWVLVAKLGMVCSSTSVVLLLAAVWLQFWRAQLKLGRSAALVGSVR